MLGVVRGVLSDVVDDAVGDGDERAELGGGGVAEDFMGSVAAGLVELGGEVLAVVGEGDEGGAPIGGVWGAVDQAGGLEGVDEGGDVAGGAAQCLGELTLDEWALVVQDVEDFGAGGGQAALG